MSDPVQRLHDLLDDAQTRGLEASVSLADLGGLDEVVDHAGDLAVHPLAPVAARVLIKAGAIADEALTRFARAVPAQSSLLALHDTCDALLADARTVEVAGAVLHDALVPSLEDRTHQPLLAATRLEAALRLVLLGARPAWKVLAALTEDVTAMPEEHRDRLPRLLGVFLDTPAADPGRADLLTQLTQLADLDADDALAELGAQSLREALTQEEPELVRDGVLGAAAMFDRAVERDEAREDCTALAACARAVVAFADRDAHTLHASASLARAASATLALNLRGCICVSGPRRGEVRRAGGCRWPQRSMRRRSSWSTRRSWTPARPLSHWPRPTATCAPSPPQVMRQPDWLAPASRTMSHDALR